MYTREELEAMPIKRLIDIVLQLQDNTDKLIRNARILSTVKRTLEGLEIETPSVMPKRGRPALTPEQKAAAYERQKQMQKEKYWAKKIEK